MRKIKIVSVLLVAFGIILFASCGKEKDKGVPVPDIDDVAEWIDLGLPSGLLWALHNMGADNACDYGDYYAWGEIETKNTYNWETYVYCNGSESQLTKYCCDAEYGYNGFTDALTELEPSDDAANVNLGDGARIPTKAEWEELQNNCIADWMDRDGVYGYRFTGTNGNSIFLPAAGYKYESGVYYDESYGAYLSTAMAEDSPFNLWTFYILPTEAGICHSYRCGGFSVRPVRMTDN